MTLEQRLNELLEMFKKTRLEWEDQKGFGLPRRDLKDLEHDYLRTLIYMFQADEDIGPEAQRKVAWTILNQEAKRQRFERARFHNLDEEHEDMDTYPSPAELVGRAEAYAILHEVIDNVLSADERAVIHGLYLCEQAQLTQQQVAMILGISQTCVWNRKTSALECLRDELPLRGVTTGVF